MSAETKPDPGVPMQPVQSSSNVSARGYDSANQKLYVEFKGGAVYEYRNVPPEVWSSWTAAESAGKFFLAEIKPVFLDFTKLPKQEKDTSREDATAPAAPVQRVAWPFPSGASVDPI